MGKGAQGMNRTKIDWADWSWNPVSGCLGPNNDGAHCSYCYAKRIAERFRGGKAFPNGFEPTWHPERLDEPAKVKAPSRIFVGSMTDMGAPWIERKWMNAVLAAVECCPQHMFIFLTKQPDGFLRYDWPKNAWLGVTVTDNEEGPPLRFLWRHVRRLVSFEPLLAPPLGDWAGWLDFLQWAIIGAQTGPRAIAPQREWIADLLKYLDYYKVPVFMKNNLRPYWDGEWRQEWPK